MKITFYITGMYCGNCKTRIEASVRKLPGVSKFSVQFSDGLASLEYQAKTIQPERVYEEIKRLGYSVSQKSRVQRAMTPVFYSAVIIALYALLQHFNLLALLVPTKLAESGMGYGMLFVVGLITSVHCLAMCGGINLSQTVSAGRGKDGAAGISAALQYNLGRVISYTLVGFVCGAVGMLFHIGDTGVSSLFQGIIKLVVGCIMVIMGLNLLGIFPFLRKLRLQMPKFLCSKKPNLKGSKGPFVVGILNGFMPCGPLQSMQILALASGNAFVGALSMFCFSLGTVPLMLGFGSLVAALGKRFTEPVLKIGAILVAVLGLAMVAQGGSLSGLISPEMIFWVVVGLLVVAVSATLPYRKKWAKGAAVGVCAAAVALAIGLHVTKGTEPSDNGVIRAVLENGIQVVETELASGEYPDISVTAGIPVKWIVHATEDSINGCNYKMYISDYGIEYSFHSGENVIEFTPSESGTVRYSCWMGMIHGNIHVES